MSYKLKDYKEYKLEDKKDLPYWIKFNQENKRDFSSQSLVATTREYINNFYTEIANRTLAQQFLQFKTPRDDINELIVENKKTYQLSKAEVEKYLEAIIAINKNLGENNMIRTIGDMDNISIDIEGFSIDIAQKLGTNYLRGNFILVSTKQRNTDVIRCHTSFGANLIYQLFERYYKTIEQILLGEPLIGKMCDNVDTNIQHSSLLIKLIKDPDSVFNIEINFDTPSNTIIKLRNIRQDEKELYTNPKRIKDRKFLSNLFTKIKEVTFIHGPIDRIPDIDSLQIKENINYYKLNFNDLDIYCLKSKDQIPVFIYFDYGKEEEKLRENCIKNNLVILNGEDINNINKLSDLGIIGYSPYLGFLRAINMIARYRRQRLEKFIDKNPESSEEIKKLFLEELMSKDDIPTKAKELLLDIQSLIKNLIRDKQSVYNLGISQIYMSYPLIQNSILYEILSRMENDEIKTIYNNTDKFINIISNLDDNGAEKFIKEILESLEFKEENNPIANKWLKDNRKDLCQKLGIRFIDVKVI